MVRHRLSQAIGLSLLGPALWGAPALAYSIYVIEDPPVDFEVIDAEPFDGIGDNGPFSIFNDALLGTVGEARSMAEFDLSGFSIPPGEVIDAATFEVRITAIDIFGLGVDGETPEYLAVDGYIGNGVAELSDFQAGDGNPLAAVPTPEPSIGQVVSFDVTSFVTEVVQAEERFAGITIRAGTFGGLMMEEGSTFPKLTIETRQEPVMVGPVRPMARSLLHQNVPNPFTVSTRIDYEVSGESGRPVLLTIHDAAGRLVYTTRTIDSSPGRHSIIWYGANQTGASVPAGVYFCRVQCNGSSETRRMLLVR